MTTAKTDIIKRLRAVGGESWNNPARIRNEAANEIEQLRAELDALRAKIEAMEKQEPVAKVRVHQTGGNAGLAWSVAPLNDFDSLPLMRDGDRLYALPGAQNAPSVPDGWREAAIAWGVCASIHREYARGKDPFFSTRQKDFEKHANDARAMLAAAPEAK